MIWSCDMMFNPHVVKQSFIQLVAEFCPPVRNYNIWAPIPSKYYVQLLSYCRCLLVRYGDHFHPFCEEALDTEDIRESL